MKDIFQFLNELREKCRSLTNEKDIFENGVIKVPIEDLDKLIGIVEQKQKEIERYRKACQSYLQACDELEAYANEPNFVLSIVSELREALEAVGVEVEGEE